MTRFAVLIDGDAQRDARRPLRVLLEERAERPRAVGGREKRLESRPGKRKSVLSLVF